MAKNREIQNHETEGVREAASSMPPEGTTTTPARSGNQGGRPPGSRNRNPATNAATRKAPSKLPPNSAPSQAGMTGAIDQVSPLFVGIGKCVGQLRSYGLTEAQILTSVREAF